MHRSFWVIVRSSHAPDLSFPCPYFAFAYFVASALNRNNLSDVHQTLISTSTNSVIPKWSATPQKWIYNCCRIACHAHVTCSPRGLAGTLSGKVPRAKPTALSNLRSNDSDFEKARTRQISTLAATNTTRNPSLTTHTTVKMENDRGELVDL
jgi:hypothetical protein